MAQPVFADLHADATLPHIRTIGVADIKDALARGLDDFRAMPSQVFFLSLIYPIIGLVLGKLVLGHAVLPLLFPLLAGFSLIGPVASTGLYELSRRREEGLDVSWAYAFGVLRSPAIRPIAALGIVLMAFFILWLYAAQAIYQALFSDLPPASVTEFARQIFTTPSGWALIVIGNGIGFFFAVAVLTLSVVSFPMLIDRHVSLGTAVHTSVRAVLANPLMMALWGLIVAAGLVIGSLPFLIGLAVVLPVLGHATWHLYRKVVER